MHRRRLLLVLLVLIVAGSALTPPVVRWWLGPESPLRMHGIRAVESWMPEIRAAAAEAALPDAALLAGLVYAESRGRPEAVSSIGARGLCQLMPATAAEGAAALGLDSSRPLAPADNLRVGAHYLAAQLQRFEQDLDLALLAYRLGPTRVARELRAAGSRAAYAASLQKRRPSPWGYCEQVRELREIFAARAAPDVPADSGGR